MKLNSKRLFIWLATIAVLLVVRALFGFEVTMIVMLAGMSIEEK